MCRLSSYARKEPAGGPLLKGRRKFGAETRGDAYTDSVADRLVIGAAATETSAAAIPIGEVPAEQSPRQLHWRDSPSLL
jgi:hypothetical protein